MKKIIVAGSREFDNYEYLKTKLDYYLQNIKEEIVIISGGAKGADTLGETYAKEKGYQIKQYLANWVKFGKQAGYIRNKEMALIADYCIVFWDDKSKGSKHMIDLALKYRLKVKVVKIT